MLHTQEVDDELQAKLRPVDGKLCSLGWLQKLNFARRIVFLWCVAKAKEVVKVRLLYLKGLASSCEQEAGAFKRNLKERIIHE